MPAGMTSILPISQRWMHSLASAVPETKFDKPLALRSRPQVAATVGRRISPSISNTLSICARASPKFKAMVDLPSLGVEEVTTVILAGASRLLSTKPVRMVRIDSANWPRLSLTKASKALSVRRFLTWGTIPNKVWCRRSSISSGRRRVLSSISNTKANTTPNKVEATMASATINCFFGLIGKRGSIAKSMTRA